MNTSHYSLHFDIFLLPMAKLLTDIERMEMYVSTFPFSILILSFVLKLSIVKLSVILIPNHRSD